MICYQIYWVRITYNCICAGTSVWKMSGMKVVILSAPEMSECIAMYWNSASVSWFRFSADVFDFYFITVRFAG